MEPHTIEGCWWFWSMQMYFVDDAGYVFGEELKLTGNRQGKKLIGQDEGTN
jgi:hypothetical protein